MHDRILFPTDGSDGASAVFDHVLDLAEDHGSELHILNVADTTKDSVTVIGGEVIDALEREGERIVEETAEHAASRNVTTVTDVLQGGVPETITTYAEEYDMDLIAMPTRGRTGLERLLLGSTTERVIRHATVPVLTLRPDDDLSGYPYSNVLVPTDGSEPALAALDEAVDIVKTAEASLHVLSVVDVTSLGVDVHSEMQVGVLQEQANDAVAGAEQVAKDVSVESIIGTIERGSSVYRAILSYADDHDIDLVVMGTHGRTGVDRYVLGSVTEKIVRSAPIPVLTVRTSGSNA